MLDELHQLPSAALRGLAASLRGGALSHGLSRHAVGQIAGAQGAAVCTCLERLAKDGMSGPQVALLAEAIADARDRNADPGRFFELVLSGPDLPGVPTRDTAAVMHALIEAAETEVLLVGYAVHNGRRLFERLAERMVQRPGLRVAFCLDITRPYRDTSLPAEVVRRFCREFRTKHWPWPTMPELHHDPRSLADGTDDRSSLHAKCVVVDSREALVTSANFTEAAQRRNIEAGVLIRHVPVVRQIMDYFRGLQAAGLLVRCPLE